MAEEETKLQLEESIEEETEETQEEKEEVKEEEPKEEEVEEEEEEQEEKDAAPLEKEEVKKEEEQPKQETEAAEGPETPLKDSRPLYDQPLEVSGKRVRNKVERFVQEAKKEEVEVVGNGTPFGDIPFIEAMVTKMQNEDLKVLHRVAYGRPGSGSEIKKNLRKFNGFPFTKEDKKYEQTVGRVEKILMSEIKKMMQVLGLERSGNKGEVVDRLMDFLVNPTDSGKKPPKDKTVKRKRPKKVGKQKKKENNTAAEDSKSGGDSESGSDDDDEEEDKEDEEQEEEEEEEKPKKTPKKTPAKKTPAKKAPKKTPAKRAKSATKAASDSSSDDDVPLAKKTKQQKPPTDSELKTAVKKILDGADLEEVTMKSVCRQVYDSYPDFDLGHKKDFIKETVKSIIS